MTEVRRLTTDAEWDRAVDLLAQLWTGKTEAEILAFREGNDGAGAFYRDAGLNEWGSILEIPI